jgi:hypothetical protein
MAEIEHLEVGLQKLSGNLVVERLMRVMALLEEAAYGNGDLFRVRLCRERLCRGKRGQNDKKGDGCA